MGDDKLTVKKKNEDSNKTKYDQGKANKEGEENEEMSEKRKICKKKNYTRKNY